MTLGFERDQGLPLFVPISDGWLDLVWEHCTFNCFCICDCLCGCLFLFITSVSRSTIFAADTFQWLTAPSSVFAQLIFFCSTNPLSSLLQPRQFFSVFNENFSMLNVQKFFLPQRPPPHFLQYLNLSVQWVSCLENHIATLVDSREVHWRVDWERANRWTGGAQGWGRGVPRGVPEGGRGYQGGSWEGGGGRKQRSGGDIKPHTQSLSLRSKWTSPNLFRLRFFLILPPWLLFVGSRAVFCVCGIARWRGKQKTGVDRSLSRWLSRATADSQQCSLITTIQRSRRQQCSRIQDTRF